MCVLYVFHIGLYRVYVDLYRLLQAFDMISLVLCRFYTGCSYISGCRREPRGGQAKRNLSAERVLRGDRFYSGFYMYSLVRYRFLYVSYCFCQVNTVYKVSYWFLKYLRSQGHQQIIENRNEIR